ncbi:MAG: methionyl-tRNA formyltransferase [Alphaproteobacteria bacterium]|nr:methionyl-tRNA formyltransferase [Alphaproteobacteria bacterium]
MSRLRLIFMGTPDFAVPALKALVEAGHEIACVYCQPPRPAGRGHKVALSAVQKAAENAHLAVRTPKTLTTAEEQSAFAAFQADAAVVAAYGLILPKPILEAPRLGCLNIHASLLPRWRGAAPIQRAVLAGDAETGVTIMQMDEGLDTGPILLSDRVPIGEDMTAPMLHDALADLGADLILEALDGVADGRLAPTPQPEGGVTYAAKLSREEGRLDWSQPAVVLARQVRAFTPWPGAWFTTQGERIKVLDAEAVAGSGPPGEVLDDRLMVACGTGALRLKRVQRPGRAAMDAADLLLGFRIEPGSRLPAAEPVR